jgi:hypothetical protein
MQGTRSRMTVQVRSVTNLFESTIPVERDDYGEFHVRARTMTVYGVFVSNR